MCVCVCVCERERERERERESVCVDVCMHVHSACMRVHMCLHVDTRLLLHVQARVSACAYMCACLYHPVLVCQCLHVVACIA